MAGGNSFAWNLDRRQWLQRGGLGLGALGLAQLLQACQLASNASEGRALRSEAGQAVAHLFERIAVLVRQAPEFSQDQEIKLAA